MAIVNGYATLAEFRAYVREAASVTTDDSEFEQVVESASRAIDAYCGRRFYQDSTASARVYRSATSQVCHVDDISTTTGLLVAVDSGTGTYSQSLTISTDFFLEPLNGVVDGLAGWPYTRIVLPTRSFPAVQVRPAVQVTARWGWAAVPDPVNLACKMLGLEHYRQRDVAFGVMGMGDFATRLRANPQVSMLLDPYRTSRTAVPSV